MSIYTKLFEVMKEIDYIQKDGKVAFGNTKYNYVSESALKEKFHAAFLKHRVLFLPYQSELEERVGGLGRDGKEALTTVKLSYRFIDVDTGESYEGQLHGVGIDSGDKGLYKAFTGALKYIFHTSFVIPTGDDPEKEELSKEEKKQARADGHAAQQAVADRKIAQMQAVEAGESWDWRNALGLYTQYEQRFGKEETRLALLSTGLNSLEETKSREHATEVLGKIKKLLIHPGGEPDWAKTKAKPESKLEKAAAPLQGIASHLGLAKQSDPLQRMLERMGDFKGRLAVIQQGKFDLVQKFGEKEGAQRYYEVLDKHSGHNDTHANEIAKNAEKSRFVASELYLELHPEEVEEEVNA